MKSILYTWLGRTDLEALSQEKLKESPIFSALSNIDAKSIVVLSNYPMNLTIAALENLKKSTDSEVLLIHQKLRSPIDHTEIYNAVRIALDESESKFGIHQRIFHLTPGTPAMSSIWLLLGKSIYPAQLVATSKEQGFQKVEIPFQISAEFSPSLHGVDDRLIRLLQSLPPEAPEFDEILYQSQEMEKAIGLARKLAPRNVPVLVLGETGTGKELIARSIHKASTRYDKPFVPVNCGALPRELIDSELFGHKKGSFTGAEKDRKGYVEAAHSGTLFLDEIGELPLHSQVRLLRVLQEGEVTPVGATTSKRVNFRVIAATNVPLYDAVREGTFREDLFHRIGVGIIQVPPLRSRTGDIGLLIEHFLIDISRQLNRERNSPFTLTPDAKTFLLQQPWYGNVRELQNSLLRAALWATEDQISEEDVQEAMLPFNSEKTQETLHIPPGFDANKAIAELKRSYAGKALELSGGHKTKAAELLGLNSYQVLDKWRDA
jgi:transcriptional regulator with PAS, ATPase and Fis domain